MIQENFAKFVPKPLDETTYFRAKHFVSYIIQEEFLKMFTSKDLYTKGYHIYTTIDINNQESAEQLFQKLLPQNTTPKRIQRTRKSSGKNLVTDSLSPENGSVYDEGITGGLLAVENYTGAIKIFIGGKNYNGSKFNRVSQAQRQVGSSWKPFVYAAALEQGLTMDTIRTDSPITIGKWSPKNYGGKYSGAMSLATALTYSINTIAVKLAKEVGVHSVKMLAIKAGIPGEKIVNNLTMALGSSALTLRDMVQGYTIFANEGQTVPIYGISHILDNTGNEIYRHKPTPKQVISPQTALDIKSAMVNVIDHGTGYAAKIPNQVVFGKTGTTNEWRSAWFIGGTETYLMGLYLGYDDNTSLGEGFTGGSKCAPIWKQFALQICSKFNE